MVAVQKQLWHRCQCHHGVLSCKSSASKVAAVTRNESQTLKNATATPSHSNRGGVQTHPRSASGLDDAVYECVADRALRTARWNLPWKTMSTRVAHSNVAAGIKHAVDAAVVADDANVVLGDGKSLRGPIGTSGRVLPIVHSWPDVEFATSRIVVCPDVPCTLHPLAEAVTSNLALVLHAVTKVLSAILVAIGSVAASDIRLGESHASCCSSVLARNIVGADVIHARTIDAAAAEIQAELANLVPAAVLVIPALPSAGWKQRS